ncbi:MAG: EAL domain-containing protein, partial [Hydrogenovibrio sp.]
ESIENQSMVNAMIAMAKALGLEVVTEGVETYPQYQWLLAQDVNLFQGYLLGKPKPHFIQH